MQNNPPFLRLCGLVSDCPCVSWRQSSDCSHQDDEESHGKMPGNRTRNTFLPGPGRTRPGIRRARPLGARSHASCPQTRHLAAPTPPPLSAKAGTHFRPQEVTKSGLLGWEQFCFHVLHCVKVQLHFPAQAVRLRGAGHSCPRRQREERRP